MRGDWRPTDALVRAVTLGLGGAALAVWLRRPDLAILAAPLLTYWLVAAFSRPRRSPEATLVSQDASLELAVREPDAAGPPVLCLVQWPQSSQAPLSTPDVTVRTDAEPQRARYDLAGYGTHRVGEADVVWSDAAGAWRLDTTTPSGELVWHPPRRGAGRLHPLVDPTGPSGAHPSRRPGSGGTVAGVRPYVAGDDRRSVNWRVTARRGELHSTVRDSERAGQVLIVADTRWVVRGRRSSLDVTLDAAARLLEQYAEAGDLVSWWDPTGRLPALPPGSGHAHIERGFHAIEEMAVDPTRRMRPLAPPRVPPGSVVLVCSPLLDDAILDSIGRLSTRGTAVAVVDTLPPEFGTPDDPDAEERVLAHRLRRLQRAEVIAGMRARGVPVVTWSNRAPVLLADRLRALKTGGRR